MAYTIETDSIIEIAFAGHVDDQRMLSLFHYQLSSTAQSDGQAFLEAVLSELTGGFSIQSLYLGCCSESYLLDYVTAQMIWSPTGPARRPRVSQTRNLPGLIEVVAMPSSVAVAITKRTETAGRAGIGTLHMPGVPSTWVENSRLTSAALEAYGEFADDLDSTLTTSGGDLVPVLYHRNSPANSPTITNANVEGTSRTMRRRVVGRGI